jgi:hypothetical protein
MLYTVMDVQEYTNTITAIEVNLPPSSMENPIKSPIKTQKNARRQVPDIVLP